MTLLRRQKRKRNKQRLLAPLLYSLFYYFNFFPLQSEEGLCAGESDELFRPRLNGRSSRAGWNGASWAGGVSATHRHRRQSVWGHFSSSLPPPFLGG